MRSREPDQRGAAEIEQHRVSRVAGLDLVAAAGNEPAQSIVGATPTTGLPELTSTTMSRIVNTKPASSNPTSPAEAAVAFNAVNFLVWCALLARSLCGVCAFAKTSPSAASSMKNPTASSPSSPMLSVPSPLKNTDCSTNPRPRSQPPTPRAHRPG